MPKLIIESASGAVVELDLEPGIALPKAQPGDKIKIVLADGQVVQPTIDGNDIVVTVAGTADAPAETFVFEDLALYLSDNGAELSVVDADTGAVLNNLDIAQIVSGVEPAAGPDTAPAPQPATQQSSARFNNQPSFEEGDENADRGQDDAADQTLIQQVYQQSAVDSGSNTIFVELRNTADADEATVDEGSTTGTDTVISVALSTVSSVTGQAIDGYIVGATVFADANGNGIQDTGEAFTITGSNGLFTLTGGSGPLVLTGGTDVSTGESFQGTLTAPSGSTVVTPLTTLVQSMVEDGTAANTTAAQQLVKSALGLTANANDIDLTAFDPIANINTTGAADVISAAIKVQNTIVQAAKVLDGASSGANGFGTVTSAVYSSLATALAGTNGSSYGIDEVATLRTLITNSAASDALNLSNDVQNYISNGATDAATVISASNGTISGFSGDSGTTLLTNLAQVAYVSQNAAGESLKSAFEQTGNPNLTDTLREYTNDPSNPNPNALTAKFNNADIGDVDGAIVGTAANETLNGTANNDVIDGGAGADTLNGLGGNDRLIGGLGDDILNGGAGNDNLTGGSGNDTFVIAPGEQADTIEDFASGDRIDMTAYVTAGQTLALSQSGSNTLITANGVTQVTVKGKAPSDLWVAPDGTVTINTAPVANTSAITGLTEDSTATGTLSATDADAGTTLTFAIVSQPSAGQITITNANTGAFSFDPQGGFEALGAGESATRSFTYSVSDGNVTVNKTATLTITGQNDAPVAVTTAASVEENAILNGQVTATDVDATDTATFSLLSGPTPASGTLEFNADGTFTYDPGNAFDSLGDGDTAQVTFNYRVTDSQGASDDQTVTITINGTNDTPIIGTVAVTTNEDTSITDGDLTDFITDTDGDALTFTLVSGTSMGTLTFNPDNSGKFTFDPGTAFQGLDDGETSVQTFTYTVSDGTVTLQRTGTVTVTGANDAPTGITTAVAAFEDTTVTGTLEGADVDIEPLTFALVANSLPANKGSVTVNSDGTFSFDPGTDFQSLPAGGTEQVTFQYTVSDGDATSAANTVTITVTGSNDSPTIDSATITLNTDEDTTLTGTLPGSDVDTGDTLTFSIVSAPAAGTLSITNAATGAYSFTPGSAFQGLADGESTELSFVYQVQDAAGATAQKTASIVVTGANDAPTGFYLNLAHDDDAVSVDLVSQTGTVIGTVQGVIDADVGDTFTSTLLNDASERFELVGNEIRVAEGAVFALGEEITISIRVTDGEGATFDKDFEVSVNNVINGNSADGYISGATVFADADGDLVVDGDEATATTDIEGNFQLTDGDGTLVMFGGTDVSTNLAFEGVLFAPAESSIITPLTSIIAKMIGNGASDAADAQTKLAAATGISDSLTSALSGSGAASLLHFDPVARSVDGVTGAIDVMAAGVRVQNSIDIIASALVGATESTGDTGDDVTAIQAMNASFAAMAAAMSANDFAGLTDADAVEAIINAAAVEAGLSSDLQDTVGTAAADVATIIAASNSKVDQILNDAPQPIDEVSILAQLAQVSIVAQGNAGAAVEAALAAGDAVATANYTGDNLNDAVDDAADDIGDVDGNDAPIVTAGLTQTASEDGTLNGSITATDADTALADLSFSLDSTAKKGSLTLNSDGTFAYTPGAALQALALGESTTDTFSFTLTDGIATVSQTVTITINGANDGPVAETATISGVSEDTSFSGTLSGSDVDAGAVLTYAIVSQPVDSGSNPKGTLTLTDAATGAYTFDPGNDFQDLDDGETGTVTFAYTVTDENGATSPAKTVTVTVTGRNDAPEVTAAAIEAGDSSTATGQLEASDIDGDNLTFTLDTDTPLGSITINANGTYSFDPGTDFEGLGDGDTQTVEFTYTVSDGTVTVAQIGTVTVTGADDAPIAVTSGFSTNEDTAVTGQLVATDTDSTDLTFALVSGPGNGNGTLVINSDGTYSFDPGNDFQDLAAGDSPYVVNFTYSVADDTTTVTKAATITVSGVNDAPTVSAAVTLATIAEDGTLIISEADLLANASDPDKGDTLSVQNLALTDSSDGTLVDNGNGTWTFTPTADFNGTVGYTYDISDGTATVSTTASLTVSAVNDAPVAQDGTATTGEDSEVTGTVSATDADGDTLTYSIVSQPVDSSDEQKGSVTINAATGEYTFNPGTDFQGLDTGESEIVTFTYQADDGNGGTDTKTVTVTVTGANDAPVATTSELTTTENTILTGSLEATDPDGDSLTFAKFTSPAKGTLTIGTDGSYSFDPGTAFDSLGVGQSEVLTFKYTVSDGTETVQKVATITVNGTNDAPVAVADSASTFAGDTLSVSADAGVLANDTDIDSSPLTVTTTGSITTAAGATVTMNADGSYTYDASTSPTLQALSDAEFALDTFTYTVSDGDGGTAVGTVTINVTGSLTTSDAIFLEDGVLKVDADQLSLTSLDVSAYDVDIEFLSLGNLTGITTKAGQNIQIDAADIEVISEADATFTISGETGVDDIADINIVGADLVTGTDGTTEASVRNLLALEFAGLDAQKSLIPDNLTVDGSHANALLAFWIPLDDNYVGAQDFYNLPINTSFVYLGNDYVEHLMDGNPALLDIVKITSNRAQSAHDNLFGNLGNKPISDRFTNPSEASGLDPQPDPRTQDTIDFGVGERPYHGGHTSGGVYASDDLVALTVGWDRANGVTYPDTVPVFYDVLDGANTVTGTTDNGFVSGDDFIYTGDGDDTIVWNAGGGNDAVDGGADTDLVQLNGDASADSYTITAGTGEIDIAVDEDGDSTADADLTLTNVEDIEVNTGNGADTVTISGDFTDTGLATSTIAVNGGDGGIIVDASGVTSAHSIDVTGGIGADIFTGGLGDDSFDGGDGEDTFNLSGNRADYTLGVDGDGNLTLTADGEGTDTVENVEILAFADETVSAWTVAADGSGDFTSLHDALASSEVGDGDIITVAAGSYTFESTLTIDKSVTLLGAQANTDPRSAAGLRTEGGTGESILDGGGTLGTLIRIEADNVTINGFDIGGGTGDLITSSSSSAIANPVISYNFVHDSSGDEGMQIRNASSPVVEYNNVHDTAGDGINFAGDNPGGGVLVTTNGIIRSNEVHNIDSPDAAIYVYGSTNTTIAHNIVYTTTANDGIKMGSSTGSDAGSSGGSITGNTIFNTLQDAISVYMSDVEVSGNDVTGSSSENGAIFVDFDVDNVAITGNTIHDNGTDGDGNDTFAIRVGKDSDPTNVEVSGNTLTGNELQIFLKDPDGTGDSSSLEDVLAANVFDGAASYQGSSSIWSSLADALANAPDEAEILVANGDAGIIKYDAQLAHAAPEQSGGSDGFHPGSGNSDVNFTISDNPTAGIEAALKAKLRYAGDLDPENGSSTYFAETGTVVSSSGVEGARWNFDYSVITYGDIPLSDLGMVITVDFVGLDGTRDSDVLTFDAVSLVEDYGSNPYYEDDSGETAGYQNSQNLLWYVPDFDPDAAGSYELTLTVTNTATSETLTTTQTTTQTADIIVGNSSDPDSDVNHDSIADAISDASAGDVILVKPSFTTSETSLAVDKAITLLTDGASLTADAAIYTDGEGTLQIDVAKLPSSYETLDVSGLGGGVSVAVSNGDTLSQIVAAPNQSVDVDGETYTADADGTSIFIVSADSDYSTIQAAVDAASDGDIIIVQPGTYEPFGMQFGGTANLTIVAPDGATIEAPTIDDVPSTGRIVDLRADGTHFEGFTITGPGGGAGTSVGVSVGGQGVTVTGNTIGNTLTGIQTLSEYDTGGNTITDNTIDTRYGISLQNDDNMVTGNDVTASDEGLGILGGMTSTVSGNSFTITDGGEAMMLYPHFDTAATSFDITTSNNIVTTSDGTTLQNAVDLAGTGGTVNVGDGSYDAITINQSVTLLSVNGAENVTITGPGVSQQAGIRIDDGVSGVNIGDEGQGFTINTASGDLASIYLAESASNISIEGNVLNGGSGHAFLTTGSISNVLVDGNVLASDGPVAVAYVNGETSLGASRASDNVDFTDNSFIGGDNAGLLLGVESTNSEITGNSFTGDSSYAGIELWAGDSGVTGNSFAIDGDVAVLDSTSSYDDSVLAANNTGLITVASDPDTLYHSLQAAIDAAEEGDVISVYPGEYSEIANYSNSGNSTIEDLIGVNNYPAATNNPVGLLINKSVTIQGVDNNGDPITDVADIAATVTSQQQSNWGANFFVTAADVTITGLQLLANGGAAQHYVNKAIEVINDGFTLNASVVGAVDYDDLHIKPDADDNLGGSWETQTQMLTAVYIYESNGIVPDDLTDWESTIESFSVSNSVLRGAVELASGIGYGHDTLDMQIVDNTFRNVSDTDDNLHWTNNGIIVTGIDNDIAWRLAPAAQPTEVTGNTFVDGVDGLYWVRGAGEEQTFPTRDAIVDFLTDNTVPSYAFAVDDSGVLVGGSYTGSYGPMYADGTLVIGDAPSIAVRPSTDDFETSELADATTLVVKRAGEAESEFNLILGDDGSADNLAGTNDADALFGGLGDDILDGDEGADLIIGGDGSDTLTGGDGNDTFVLSAGDTGTDIITDFTSGDIIDVSDVLGDAAELVFADDGSGGSMVMADSVHIATVENVAPASLSLDAFGNVTLSETV